MVLYNSTVCNSLDDLIQFIYSEDGMDGAFIERQKIDTFALSNTEFEHKSQVDVMDKGGFLPGVLQIGIDDSSLELQAKLNKEYGQLVKDRQELCTFIFPRADGLTPHYMPVNLYQIIQNTVQIFHIDRQKLSHLEPAYIVNAVWALTEVTCCTWRRPTQQRGTGECIAYILDAHLCDTCNALCAGGVPP